MTGLKEGLELIAADAKSYGDVDRAVVTAYRRRRNTLVAAAVAVLVLVAGTVAVAAPHLVGRHRVEPAAPPTVTAPASAPALPSDRGVGRGVALYQPTTLGPTWLYTADGHWYDTGIQGAGEKGGAGPALSPDGRWLYRPAGNLTDPALIRDLSGTGQLHAPGAGNMLRGWSPDDRYALFERGGMSSASLTRLDLANGGTPTVFDPSPLLRTEKALYVLINARVRPDGNIVLPLRPSGGGDGLDLVGVDPATGAQTFRVHLPGSVAQPFSDNAPLSVQVGGDGGHALVNECTQKQISANRYSPYRCAWTVVDLRTGGYRAVTGMGDGEAQAGTGAGGFAVQRRQSDGRHFRPGVQVVRIDPTTGATTTTVVYQVPIDDRLFALPGQQPN